MNKLWPHQEKALALTASEFSRGHQAVCIVMSTGAGKTHTGGAIASRHIAKSPTNRVLWVAHRDELVIQAADSLATWGLEVGVIQANCVRQNLVNPYRRVQVASTQTLLARNQFPDATMLILDELHHYASDKWIKLGEEYRRRKIPLIGLTATPIRADGRGFEGLMDALVCPISMRQLIDGGFLVPFELKAPATTLKNNQIAQDPCSAYRAHGLGRRAIVFCGNVKAATEYATKFREVGISAEPVWGAMDMAARRRVLDDYKSGRCQVLTNVGVLTEGFDDRPTSCVILARSVGSLSLYLQMVGRALRVAPGKSDAIIIDLHGSCRIHGSPDEDREWTLEGDGIAHKPLERPTDRFCPGCKVLLADDSVICDLCGHVRPEAAPPEVTGAPLVKYAAKLREPVHVREAYFRKLQAVAQSKGWSKWQPVQKYKAIYGEPPLRIWYA